MNDRAVTYNNAGVYFMMQQHHDGNDAAMDLFLGARACLRQQAAEAATAPVLDPAIVRAELRLADLNSHRTQEQYQQQQQQPSAHGHPQQQQQQQQQHPYYLIQKPFAIPRDIFSSPSCTSLCHVVILFNLGLTVQLQGPDPTSDRVVTHLYHTASAILADIPDSHATLVLAMAILNNTGVWCQQSGDRTAAASCMEQLNVLLQEEAQERVLQPEVLQGITANVVTLLVLWNQNNAGAQDNEDDDAQDGLPSSSVVSPAA